MKIMKTFLFIHVIKVYNHKSQSNILLYNCTSSYSFFSSVFNMFHYIFVYFKNSKGGGMVADFLVTSSNFVVRRPDFGQRSLYEVLFYIPFEIISLIWGAIVANHGQIVRSAPWLF